MPGYQAPSVRVQALGSQQLLNLGPAASTIVVPGTAPFGPDSAVLINPAQAKSLFGDPATAAAQGFTLPTALDLMARQASPINVNTPVQFVVCRVGVTRAAGTILDATTPTAVTSFTFQPIGAYAGSRGANLQMVITTTGTGPTAVVTSIAINDISSGTPVQLRIYTPARFNLTTNAAIIAAINGDNPLNDPSSIVQVTLGSGAAVVPKTQSVTATGGTDGRGATAADATIAPLLVQSLGFYADYICPLFDGAAISTALLSHLNTAVAQNNFRKAIVGPALGTTYGTLSTSYNSFASDRVVCIGHDSGVGPNSASGGETLLDGFYLAAAMAGLKATAPHYETCTGFPISGFSSIGIAPDRSAPLTATDLDTLGGAGLLVFEQPYGVTNPTIRDAITTAPYSINGAVNAFSQFNVRDIDDQVSIALVQAVQPFKGRPSLSQSAQTNALQAAGMQAMGRLGRTINGVNSCVASIDPNTQVQTLAASYITRYPGLQIVIQTSYSFQPAPTS